MYFTSTLMEQPAQRKSCPRMAGKSLKEENFIATF